VKRVCEQHALHQRLGHAHHVDRLAGLVGRDADHRLDVRAGGAHRRDQRAAPEDVRADRLQREVFTRRHLFQRGGVDDDVGAAYRLGHRRLVSDVADAEGETFVEVLIDHVVGRGALAAQP
jgi:hypothetical protein